MKRWVLDSAVAVGSLVLFIISLFVLPFVIPAGFAYILAIVIFIVALSSAGYRIGVQSG